MQILEMAKSMSPLLFRLHEKTYLTSFCLAALSTSIATGLVLEYRIADPLGTYALGKEKNLAAVLQTCVVAFISTLIVLIALHVCFGYGGSMLFVDAI